MRKQKYNLITVNIEALVKDAKEILDYSNLRERRRYLISEDQQDDCALFYQLQIVLGNRENGGSFAEDSLKQVIAFADFKSIFEDIEAGKSSCNEKTRKKAETYEKILKKIFDTGITINFAQNEKYTFKPFDKSNSMSRACKMTFLRKEYIEKVNKRLLLGINFYSMQNIKLSKYYAYKGLYLSSAVRINPADIGLTQEKLVVIKDFTTTTEYKVTKCTGKEKDGIWKLTEPESKTSKIEKLFDGEGLISRALYIIINDSMENEEEKATSFQIRMPFIKGMLHYVDFHKFLREYASLNNGQFIIEDAFGIERDLMKADIIIPISMFKCYEWVKNIDDAMGKYFAGFNEYKHSLYIANTNLSMGVSTLTTLNYQFLNTLEMFNEDLLKLIEEHLEYVRNPQNYVNAIADINSNGEYARDVSSWQLVLNENKNFVHEEKINGQLKGISESLRADIGTGHLVTKGKVCYLSRDLFFFLVKLLTLSVDESEKSVSGIIKQKFANEFLMPYDYFYLPNSKLECTDKRKDGFKSEVSYPIFRNPHLSRNEQCALRFFTPSKKSVYRKYLGHLKGVCMIGYSSVDPQALGGADFDGDLVKVFISDVIQKAVLGGAYKKVTISNYERDAALNNDEIVNITDITHRAVLRGESYYYERKLPIIDIPSPSREEVTCKPTDAVDYEVIRKTFSNKIGQISNLAIRLGQIEYNKQANEEQKRALAGHCCAECTLLTGLEIDAAKTGVHPDLEPILKTSNEIQDILGYDYISKFKEVLTGLRADKIHFTHNNLERDGNLYGYKKFKKDKKNAISYTYNKTFSLVNLLPKYFFDFMNVPMDNRGVSSTIVYFDFMRDANWKRDIDKKQRKELANIIKAYNQIMYMDRKIRAVKGYYGSGSFEAYAKNVLNLQYDDPSDYVEDVMEVLADFDSTYEDVSSFKKAIKNLKSETSFINWFCAYDEKLKKDALKSILNKSNISSSAYETLYNFGAHGYLLLYFLLSDAEGIKIVEMENSALFDELYLDDSESFLHTIFYDELVVQYKDLNDRKKVYWRKAIRVLCREKIEKFMKDNSLSRDDIMPILYSLTSSYQEDSNGDFFWNYYSSDELISHVYNEKEKEHE